MSAISRRDLLRGGSLALLAPPVLPWPAPCDLSERATPTGIHQTLSNQPAVLIVASAISQGWLGTLTQAHAILIEPVGEGTPSPIVRSSGSPLSELGGDMIDLLVATLGMPGSITSQTFRIRHGCDTLADEVLIRLEFPSATATARCAVASSAVESRCEFAVLGDLGSAAITFWPRSQSRPQRLVLTLDRVRGPFHPGTQIQEIGR